MRISAEGWGNGNESSQMHKTLRLSGHLGGGSCIIFIGKRAWNVPSLSHAWKSAGSREDPIPANCDWQSRVNSRKWNNAKYINNYTNNKTLLLLLLLHSYRLRREMI